MSAGASGRPGEAVVLWQQVISCPRSLAASLQEQLDEVEHALAKFAVGTYGLCEVSGEPIPEARLEAMPATRVRVEYA